MGEFHINQNIINMAYNKGYGLYSKEHIRPISQPYLWLCDVQKWLRERHKLYICVLLNIETRNFGYEIWDDRYETVIVYKDNSDEWDFTCYESALEAANRRGMVNIS